jgi:hypothetical protein
LRTFWQPRRCSFPIFAADAPLVTLPLPLDLPPTTFRLVWNRLLQDNPAHAWLRNTLVGIGERPLQTRIACLLQLTFPSAYFTSMSEEKAEIRCTGRI